MNTSPAVVLTSLSNLPDYRVASGEADPRGWEMETSDQIVVGDVTDLIVDVDGLVARYIVCLLGGTSPRAVLIPTGFARLDQQRRVVHLDFVTSVEIAELPTFERLPLSAQLTARTEQVLTGIAPSPGAPKIIRRRDDTRSTS
jgi:hypothetical protein